MKKVIFIEARAPGAHIYSIYVMPRLGSLILGTILKEKGYDVEVYLEDLSSPSFDQIQKADIVCISTITVTAPRAYIIADKARKAGKTVIIGGPHVTFLPDEALEHSDYVVRGEGDISFPKLIEAIENNEKPYGINGISFSDNGQIIHNPPQDFIWNLDEIPIPDYSLLKGWGRKNSITSVATSRGCPFGCKFCSVITMFGTKYRFNSIDRVIEEIKIHQKSGRTIFFCDDNFAANPKRTRELLERMLKENIKVQFSAQVRTDITKDEELVKLLAKAGCYTVFVGFESINPETLKLYDKKQSLDDIKRSIRVFKESGIHIHGMFVLGSDADDIETLRETAKFAKAMDIDSVQFMMLVPLPGTEVYYSLESQNRLLHKDWSKYNAHYAVFEPKLMTPHELQSETYRAMRKFYSWKSIFIRLFKLDFQWVFIKLYGKYQLNHSTKLLNTYVKNLKKRFWDKIEQIKIHLPTNRIKKIGLPSINIDPKLKTFFVTFFENLKIKVVEVDEKKIPDIENNKDRLDVIIREQISILTKKVDLIIVPIIKGIGEKVDDIKTGSEKFSQQVIDNIKKQKDASVLAIEVQLDNLKSTCINIGVALDKSIRKVRKAYRKALKSSGLYELISIHPHR